MAGGLNESALISLIKNKLNSERIKLWQGPYSEDDGSRAPFTQDLVKRYAVDLQLNECEVDAAVEQLRTSSLERLAARNNYQLTGLAALKIKVTMANKSKETLTIETELEAKGSTIRKEVAKKCNVELDQIKLITAGRLIVDDVSLKDQDISVMSPIMALIVNNASVSIPRSSSSSDNLLQSREDAEILAQQSAFDFDGPMQIADQNGRILNIPPKERKALGVAMVLNEKGKTALRKKEYSEALLFLLESDKEFKKCSAEILSKVDNYGLLCLDIAWCYLCLKSIEDLPDAETRLKMSEECIRKCYGDNLERLLALKGAVGSESALLVRLHLLKGIAAYYKRQYKVAEKLFADVETELKQLHVDDDKLSEVMNLGYTSTQARLALRSMSGNVEMAVNFLLNKAKEKEERIAEERKEKKKRVAAKKFGKTVAGEYINMDFLERLTLMGYPTNSAAEALIQSNNCVSLAVQIIQDHPELLKLGNFDTDVQALITEEMITQVASCGFNPNAAEKCLKKHKGNVQAAIEELISTGGIFVEVMDDSNASRASGSAHSLFDDVDMMLKQEEALGRLRTEIAEDEDAHLDLTLDEEAAVLDEYKVMLIYTSKG